MSGTEAHSWQRRPLIAAVLAGALSVGMTPAPESTAASLFFQPAFASNPFRALDPGTGINPTQLRSIYGIDRVDADGAGVTVAVVIAYHSPDIEQELAAYSEAFGLPACSKANGCLKVVYADGRKPRSSSYWEGESDMDVEIVHAIAPAAHITLVEGADNGAGLNRAVAKAIALKPQVITMSWGSSEDASVRALDPLFSRHDIAYFAASGDAGHAVDWPAVATNVVAVGGTVVDGDASLDSRTETAWAGSGGGISKYVARPAWQSGRGLVRRSVPDVSAVGGIGIAIHTQGQWSGLDGTSAATPIWAGIAALAVQLRGGRLVDLPRMLEALPEVDFFDITSGSNGTCGTPCRAGAGYDQVTGRGSPNAQRIIQALAAYPNTPTDLDTPVVSISGVESGDSFDTSSGPVNVTVTVLDPSGVSGGTLELLDRTGEVVWSTAVFAGCGTSCEATATLPVGAVAPGYYTLRTRAVDSDHNVGSSIVALGL